VFKLLGKVEDVKVRTVYDDHSFNKKGMARCAWCHHFNARPVSAVVATRSNHSIVMMGGIAECICFCQLCEKGTVVVFQLPWQDSRSEQLSLPLPKLNFPDDEADYQDKVV